MIPSSKRGCIEEWINYALISPQSQFGPGRPLVEESANLLI
jgi:hypothetical protein